MGIIISFYAPSLYINASVPGDPFVINFDRKTYQAGNQNWSIATGRPGFIYIANNNGLLEFDGSNWHIHKLNNQMVFRSVAVGNDDKIYIGGYKEFGYFERDQKGLLHYTSLSDQLDPDIFHNDEIWRIISFKDKIYFQSFSSIFIYDGKSFEIIKPDNTIVLLMKARDKLYVHRVGAGLHEVTDNQLVPVKGNQILAEDEIKFAFPFGDNELILGAANNGLFRYDGLVFTPWNIPAGEEIKNAEVNVGLYTDDSLYVIGTIGEGIFILDQNGELLNHLHAGNKLQNNTVLALAADNNNIWVGLDKGLDQIILNSRLDYYSDPAGELGTVFDAALFHEKLWLGTNQGLFVLEPQQNGFSDPVMINNSKGQVWDLEPLENELLVGHANGTYKIRKEEFIQISDINGGFNFKRMESDDGAEWLIQSTYSIPAVYRESGSGWIFSHSISGFIEPAPDLEIDHFGNLWLRHTQGGIYQVKLNATLDSARTISFFGESKGFPTNRISRLAKIENRIAFSTGSQIYTYDDLKDTIVQFQLLNDRLGDFRAATHVIKARKNYYWFINGEKIALFRIDGSDVVSQFSLNLRQYDLYMNAMYPQIVNLSEGLHLICLDQGFALIDEDKVRSQTDTAKVDIHWIQVWDMNQDIIDVDLCNDDSPVSFPYRYRNISFQFAGQPKARYAFYRYILDGLDPEWSDWSTESYLQFRRLPYGDFNFKVQTMNLNGEPGSISNYAFSIDPPWFLSITALILYGVLILIIGLYIRYMFIKKLQIQARKIDHAEKEKLRQEQLEIKQQLTELENEKLQNEIKHKNNQLADYTINLIRKNESLIKIKDELKKQKDDLDYGYPQHLYERMINLIDKTISSEDEWEVFQYHFDQTHENFFKRLKQQYNELTPSDLKLCAYLRLNLSSKELAPLLNIGIKSVEVHRSRLRKKLQLQTEDNLVEFLLEF